MTETKQRTLLERMIGRPLPWLAWMWVVLALIWLVLAIVEPSGFHTTMAIVWIILAALQLASVSFTRRQERNRARNAAEDS